MTSVDYADSTRLAANLFLMYAGLVVSVVSISGAWSDEAYRLPLAASWEVGQYAPAEQYGPTWQIRMIEAGHHMMLGVFFYRSTEKPEFYREKLEVVREAVEKAAQQHLPLTLEGPSAIRLTYSITKTLQNNSFNIKH